MIKFSIFEYLAYKIAHEDMGIYPQARVDENGVCTERTEWQNGWNAFSLAEIKKVGMIIDWFKKLPDDLQVLIESLCLENKIEISVQEDCDDDHPYAGVSLYINCSDTFFWGCADGEDIGIEELPELLECFKLSPNHGGDLWVCRKRKMRPQTACYKSRYPKEEWLLFDEAGEERTDSDGVGRNNL